MKRIISLLLCITMLLSSANVVLADEVKEDVYNTVSVEFSDNVGSLEKLQVMVKDDNVYANAEELGTRLGYDVSISDEYVSIYNKEADENLPYALTVFYYDSTKVGHMLFTQMVDSYEAPFETIKNENGVWIPLEYSLLLLNSSSLVVGNTILIEMPSKNIIDIYMDILQNNQKYLFDWQDDVGISEKNESIMGGAAFFVTLFNGLIKPDGESWLQGIQIMAMDTSAYDAKYAEELAVLFCTYSDDELSEAVKEMQEKMSPFNGDNTLTEVIDAFDEEIDKNIGNLLKKSEDLKKQIDANNNASIVAYNKSYQALENACDKADFFSDATELYTKVGKGVEEATSFLEAFYTVAEVVGFANEFKNQDEFAVNALLEFVENSDFQSVMSNAMKEGISTYAGTLQTDIVAYSGLRWLEENYDEIIFDKMKLTSALGLPANLMLIGWDVVKENVPFYEEGLNDTESFILSMYASIFQADSFTSYQNLRNTTFDNMENITSENLYEVSQYCYTYLKSCYLTREAALASLSEENEKKIPSVIEYQNAINEEIAGYLVQLKNADATNEYGCYGFLPEDNAEYLKEYDSKNESLLQISQNVAINVNEYLRNIKTLIELLDMEYISDEWHYESNEFEISWFEGNEDFESMYNNANLDIALYGCRIGDEITIWEHNLEKVGWICLDSYDGNKRYGAIIDNFAYDLHLTVNSDGTVKNWYINSFFDIEIPTEMTDLYYETLEEWKKIYLSYVRDEFIEDYPEVIMNFIYVDNDDIPELVLDYGTGMLICAIKDGKIQETVDMEGLQYIEKSGLFMISGGNQHIYYQEIWQLNSGNFEQVAKGKYGALDVEGLDYWDITEENYSYYWNEEKISKNQYEEKVQSIFDFSKEKDTNFYNTGVTYWEFERNAGGEENPYPDGL